MKLNKILLVLFLVSNSVLADDSGPDLYNSTLSKFKSNPAAVVSVQNGWTVIEFSNEDPRSIWSFTPDDHPAHPAFAKRTIMQDGTGAWYVQTKLSCGASKPECDKLALEYKDLDEKMRAAIEQDKKH
jgi:hypothetical protein